MRRHLAAIAVLLALAACVQTWIVLRAVTPAQDAVRYVRIAKVMERSGVVETIRDRPEPPLYPLSILATHRLLFGTAATPSSEWAVSAQIAAAAALVLTVIPLYVLLLRLTTPRAAMLGTLFFIVLASAARLGGDGLSDATHLLFFTAALCAVAGTPRATGSLLPVFGRANAPGRLSARCNPSLQPPTSSLQPGFLAGLFIGLAVLSRKEALVLPAVISLSVIVCQFVPRWRRNWSSQFVSLAALGLGCAAVLLPLLWMSDALTPQMAVARLLGRPEATHTASSATTAAAISKPSRPTPAYLRDADYEKKDATASLRFSGYAAAAKEYSRELPKALGYWLGGLVLVGIAARWRDRDPAALLVAVLFFVWSALAIHVAAGVGYLSPRHLLPAVVPLLGFAGEGALLLGVMIYSGLTRKRLDAAMRPSFARPACVAVAALPAALVGIACLTQTFAPLHESRAAHRQAGEWLSRADVEGRVLDTRGLTWLYSNRATYDFPAAKKAVRDKRLAFIVIERHERERDTPRARTLRRILAAGGQQVATFAAAFGEAGKAVEVYRWDPKRAATATVEKLGN